MLAQLTKQKMQPPISPWTLSPKAPSDQCGALSLFHQSGASQIGFLCFLGCYVWGHVVWEHVDVCVFWQILVAKYSLNLKEHLQYKLPP